tara:strand:- start:1309 stop:2394 length:1086 start_codon:yes stop_codon:yes gene_type:complete
MINYEILHSNYQQAEKDYISFYKGESWKKDYLNFSSKVKYKNNLINFRNKKSLTYGLDDFGGYFKTVETLIKLIDICGKKFIDDNLENTVGNPEQVYDIGGKKYNYNDLENIFNLFSITKNLLNEPKTICEIGAGYGCLLSKLKLNYPECKIISIDLPEALLLQTYYLNQIYPEKRFFLYKDFLQYNSSNTDFINLPLDDYDFFILPPWALRKIKIRQQIDLIINVDSMMEMTKKVINEYFLFIQESLKYDGIFYNVNKYKKIASGDIVKIAEYPYDDFWKVLVSKNYWTKPNIHQLITKRLNSIGDIKEDLSKLPKENIHKAAIKTSSTGIIKKIIRFLLNLTFNFIPKKYLKKILQIYY